jgi:hypothetical protein
VTAPLTADTVTDEQIRALRDTQSPVNGSFAYMCKIALGELRGGRMGSSRSEEREARGSLAQIINARRAQECTCDMRSTDGNHANRCPVLVARRAQEGK